MSRTLRIQIPSGGPVEEIEGRMDASYYPMTTGMGVVAALITARTGAFPRPGVMVLHEGATLAIEIDRLVELHLEQFRAALFEAIKSEATECELHVLRPTLELRLQLPNCDASESCAHAAKATNSSREASTEKEAR